METENYNEGFYNGYNGESTEVNPWLNGTEESAEWEEGFSAGVATFENDSDGSGNNNLIAEYDATIPDYALSYLINGDSSGLEADDIAIIDSYMKEYYAMGGNVIIDYDTDEERYFSSHPAFGSPCTVYDCKILILKR